MNESNLFMGLDIFTIVLFGAFSVGMSFALSNFMGYRRQAWWFVPIVMMSTLILATTFHLFPLSTIPSVLPANITTAQPETAQTPLPPIPTVNQIQIQSQSATLEQEVWNQRIKEYYGNVS